MSQDPLLDKMDALLKKHRGSESGLPLQEAEESGPVPVEETTPPPDAWLPVLTDVVVMGKLSNIREIETNGTPKTTAATPESHPAEPTPQAEQPSIAATESQAVSDTLAELLMGELEPKLSALLMDRISSQIHNSLDDTVSALLAQLDVNIREIVREAINERLGKP